MKDIFDIQLSNEDKIFIIKNGDLELEVLADIVETSENIPFLGSVIKLGKVGLNLLDLRYIRKIAKFLRESEELPDEEVRAFLSTLDKKDYKRIAEFLTHVLYSADEDAKAIIFGRIYKYRVLGQIDNEQMLRLLSVVNKSFVTDLNYLPEFLKESDRNDYICDNLNALGLLKDCGNVYEETDVDGFESTGFGSTKHSLNTIGSMLYCILQNSPIVDYSIEANVSKASIGFATEQDVKGLFDK